MAVIGLTPKLGDHRLHIVSWGPCAPSRTTLTAPTLGQSAMRVGTRIEPCRHRTPKRASGTGHNLPLVMLRWTERGMSVLEPRPDLPIPRTKSWTVVFNALCRHPCPANRPGVAPRFQPKEQSRVT